MQLASIHARKYFWLIMNDRATTSWEFHTWNISGNKHIWEGTLKYSFTAMCATVIEKQGVKFWTLVWAYVPGLDFKNLTTECWKNRNTLVELFGCCTTSPNPWLPVTGLYVQWLGADSSATATSPAKLESTNRASTGMWRDSLRTILPIGYCLVEIRRAGPSRVDANVLREWVSWKLMSYLEIWAWRAWRLREVLGAYPISLSHTIGRTAEW